MWKKIVNYYNTNAYFHSFVEATEAAIVSFCTSWSGGLPLTKAAWVAVFFAMGKALWSAWKRWMQTNVATVAIPMKKEIKPPVVCDETSTQGESTI
jgi:hypothetical protein